MTRDQIAWQEKEVGITAEWHEIEPPHEWFHVAMICAGSDVTKHDAIMDLPVYRVLVYADAYIKANTAPETNQETDNG